MVLGLDNPTSGRALVGRQRYQEMTWPLHEVGSLLHASALHPGRPALDHLVSVAQSNGIGRRRVDKVLELTGLATVAKPRARTFSLGMKQRLGIALALLGDLSVLVLDEPVNGLDPEGVVWTRELFKVLAAEGRTVLVSSHLMSEMALTADHLVIIGRGRLLADIALERFVESNARSDVVVRSPRAGELAELLRAPGASVEPSSDGALAITGMSTPEVGELAAERAIAFHELYSRHASLEQAYMDITAERRVPGQRTEPGRRGGPIAVTEAHPVSPTKSRRPSAARQARCLLPRSGPSSAPSARLCGRPSSPR